MKHAETLIAAAALALTLFGMWYVREQERSVNDERVRIMMDDLKTIRGELIQIERRLPRTTTP